MHPDREGATPDSQLEDQERFFRQTIQAGVFVEKALKSKTVIEPEDELLQSIVMINRYVNEIVASAAPGELLSRVVMDYVVHANTLFRKVYAELLNGSSDGFERNFGVGHIRESEQPFDGHIN